MGVSPLLVRFEDGTVMYGNYQRCVDSCFTRLFDESPKGVNPYAEGYAKCECGRAEPVDVHAWCGGGLNWRGRACRHCHAFLGPTMPYEDVFKEMTGGTPEWIPEPYRSL